MIFLVGSNEAEELADQANANIHQSNRNNHHQRQQKNYLNKSGLIFHDNVDDDDEHEQERLQSRFLFDEHELESSAGSCSEEYEDCESDDSCYIALKSHQRKSTPTIGSKTTSPCIKNVPHHPNQDLSSKPSHKQQQQSQHDIYSSALLNGCHYLTIEDLRSTINSCWLCGCDWREEHVSLDCPECGGYSLSRPCPQCDGQCKQVWCRNLSATHDLHKALWSGQCALPTPTSATTTKQTLGQNDHLSSTATTTTNINNKNHNTNDKQHENNSRQASQQRQHYAVFCNV